MLRPIHDCIQQGLAFLEDQNIDQAISCFNEALRSVPDLESANFYLGKIYFEKVDNEKAIEYFDRILRQSHESVPSCHRVLAYIYRGIIYREQDKHEAAVLDFTEALKIDQHSLAACMAYTQRSRTYSCLEQPTEANADLQLALKINSDDVEANHFLGVWAEELAFGVGGDAHDAFVYHEKVLKADSQNIRKSGKSYNSHALAYSCMAGISLRYREYDEAINYYGQALDLMPDSEFYLFQGTAYLNKYNFGEAFYSFSQALALDEGENQEVIHRYLQQTLNLSGVARFEQHTILDDIKRLSNKKLLKLLQQCLDSSKGIGKLLETQKELLQEMHAHLQTLIAGDMNKIQLVLSAACFDEKSAFCQETYGLPLEVNKLIAGNLVEVTGIYSAACACTLFSRNNNNSSASPEQVSENTLVLK